MALITCFGVGGSVPRVYYAAVNGHLIELAWVSFLGRWVATDVTASARGVPSAASPGRAVDVTCFGVDGNDPRVYFPVVAPGAADFAFNIHELAWVGQWVQTELTTRAAAPLVRRLPLTCFGAEGRSPRVYCVTPGLGPPVPPSGHVIELAFVGGWTHKDVMAIPEITEASPVGGAVGTSGMTCFGFDVSAFGQGGPAARLYYVGQDGHVHELAWDVESFQEPEGQWTHTDVTVSAKVLPLVDLSTPVTCVGVGGVEPLIPPSARIYYLDQNLHVIELAWVGRWVATDLMERANIPPAQRFSPLTCFAVGGSAPRVYYVDGHVNELAWDGTRWVHTDVTAHAVGPAPSPVGLPTDLACFGVKGTDARIYYVTPSNGHVHELAWIGSWVATDLMQSAARGGASVPPVSLGVQ